MKKYLLIILSLISCSVFAEEAHIPQKLINVNEELNMMDLQKNKIEAINIYNKMNGSIEKRSEKSINESYNKTNTCSLDFKSDERLTWAKYNLMSTYYINKGFVNAGLKEDKKENDLENNYISLLDSYTTSVEENLFNKNEEIFNFNMYNLQNNIQKFDNTIASCESKNENKMINCVSKKLTSSKDIFDKITLKCMKEKTVEKIQECRIQYINSDEFKKNISIIYYNLGYVLYKNNK